MRVFHLVNAEHGLENLRRRRLKIATIDKINDPFELFGFNLADESLRRAFQKTKNDLAANTGLLCFSRGWQNPVLWSHYAKNHSGLCLGFDIPDEHLVAVTYSRRRLVIQTEELKSPSEISIGVAQQFLSTKYSHWRYENEVRSFVRLPDRDPESNLYFADFSTELHLTTVIVGALSNVSKVTLHEALGDLSENVNTFKARLAFRSFRVVHQRDSKFWL